LTVNKAWLEFFGYSKEEVINRWFGDFLTPKSRDNFKQKFTEFKKLGEIHNIKYEVLEKNGQHTIISFDGRIWYDKNGNFKQTHCIFHNITEKIKAEQKLKESEANLRTAIESLPFPFFMVDKSGKYIMQNTTAKKVWGNLIGKTPDDIAKDEDTLKLWLSNNKRVFSGETLTSETKYLLNGESRYFYDIIAPVYIDNNIQNILGVNIDITERKITEQKLIESEEDYHLLFNKSPDYIYVTDIDGKILDVNQSFLDRMGLTKEEYRGLNSLDFFAGNNYEKLTETVELIRKGEEVKGVEFKARTPKGNIYEYEINSVPLIQDGKVKKVLNIARDITERKKAEKLLKQSEEKYRMIFNGANDPIAILDEEKIIDCNNITLELFGYKNKEEIIGNPPWKLSPNKQPDGKDSVKKANEFIKKALLGESQRFYWKHRRKDGTLFDAEISLSSFKLGNKKYIMAITRDITERKKAERELRDISQLKTELLDRTSHELKTPLISIKGFTDLLIDLHKEKFDDDTFSILEEIKQGTEQLEIIINRLLETSLLESGKIQFKPSMEDLSFLIRFCIKNLRGLAKTRNHFINIDISDNLILNFEKERIYEAIIHLIINAIKYTPPYGEIKIKAEKLDDFVIVSVQDNGIGLSENEKQNLFKQFGKIERYGQGWDIGIEGTGMGLYTSKKIVELHGGEIWVESEGRNKGAKFCFSLPLNKD